MAFVHILTKDLRPGMFIVQTGETWRSRPYLYAKPGLLKNEAEIAEIIKQGFVEAYYDPEKSEQSKEDVEDLLSTPLAQKLPEPTVSLQDEIKAQVENYNNCVDHIQHVMEEARSGRLDFLSAKPLMDNIISSLNRNADALTSLAKIKTHDEYTFAHCVNVSIFSVAFGRYLGLREENLHNLGLAGLFHDIGKMRVPFNILNAPRQLKPEEFAIMQKHAKFGEEMLSHIPNIPHNILAGVCDHHERFNGTGYPAKKKGSEISPFGCIISVCDVYDALSSKRVYKEALPPSKALSIMYGMRGESWKTGLVELFIKMLGIYPVGTPIGLTSGFKGVVTKSNPSAPLYPTVLLYKDCKGQKIVPPSSVDLAQQHEMQIIKALSTDTVDFDILTLITEGKDVPKKS
ncbi:MAG: HD-GYP domain-containing protein [Desulfovibrio sp.]|nr:HD-GYP domain-containing protein [Desulfovibrio sp.]